MSPIRRANASAPPSAPVACAYDTALAVVASSLPGPTASPAHVVGEAVAVMRRRGLIDAAFFTRLERDFTRRAAEIARVARAWCDAGDQPTVTRSSERPTQQASTVNVYHGGVHISGDAQVSTHGDIVGGTKMTGRAEDRRG